MSAVRNLLEIHPYFTGGEVRLTTLNIFSGIGIHTAPDSHPSTSHIPCKKISFINYHINYLMYVNCKHPIIISLLKTGLGGFFYTVSIVKYGELSLGVLCIYLQYFYKFIINSFATSSFLKKEPKLEWKYWYLCFHFRLLIKDSPGVLVQLADSLAPLPEGFSSSKVTRRDLHFHDKHER